VNKPKQPTAASPARDALSIEDTLTAQMRIRQPTKGQASGADSRACEILFKPRVAKKPRTDLRALSKWIRAHRDAGALTDAEIKARLRTKK
jgi:hypothetical protein